MSSTTDTSWIVPGADVVLYSESYRWTGVDITRSRIASVTRTRFRVDGPEEPVFSRYFPEAETDGVYIRYVVPADSDKGRELLRALRKTEKIRAAAGARSAAVAAVTSWDTDASRNDPAKVQAAIDALTALRDTL